MIIDDIKQKALGITTVLLGILAAFLLVVFLMTSHQLKTAQTDLTSANADIQILQSDADKLASSVGDLNRDNALLLKERDEIAALMQATERAKASLTADNAALKSTLKQLLAEAKDEHTKDWRDNTVPDDVVQLLQQAAHSATCAGNQDAVCADAGGTTAMVPYYAGTNRNHPLLTTSTIELREQSAVGGVGDLTLRRSWQM
ncbi:hypothetical protein KDN34_02995 [Shewanella yunxiaonensis]|uniref:Uncharacterized protein n=1 Tax=Shewanella yunxiaonensis TaxID=2829809 RepID=A0ABX7YWJ7_9GAMM|nr:hypothetical protein [Shewanella yunxiaonensis]QUN06446.1 hypothetical protein KDN34_02995 [Shewanella yunxiaonensis]